MALDFPASPSTGQTYTGPNGVIWQWDGSKWLAGTAAGAYAPIASPAFTGNPTAPTPPQGDADTSLATTAFVAASTAGAMTNVGRNYVHNSMFNIWQRGPGGFSAVLGSNVYTADRWGLFIGAAGDAATITRVQHNDANRAAIGDESAAQFMSTGYTGGSGADSYIQLFHNIEDVRRLAGKTVTLSFWANAGTSFKLGINLLQRYGIGGTPTPPAWTPSPQLVTLTGTFARYSVTIPMPSVSGKTFGTTPGTDYTTLAFFLSAGTNVTGVAGGVPVQSGTTNIWGVQLELGSTATPLEKLDPVTQLQQCQRFFQVGQAAFSGYSAAVVSVGGTYVLPVRMRAAPLITVTSNFDSSVTSPSQLDLMNGCAILFQGASPSGVTGWNVNRIFTASADL